MNEPLISKLELERYVAGDMPDEDTRRIAETAETDEVLRKRIEALEQSNREILAEQPPGWAARQIREKLEDLPEPRSTVSRKWLWSMPLAAALVLFVLGPDQDPAPWDGIKGSEPHLILYRDTGEASSRLEDGDRVAEGDRIQIVYNAVGSTYGFIFSVDGTGQVTRHFPDRSEAGRLRTSRPDTLAFAYRLDDAPRFERFYFITSGTTFTPDTVVDEALRVTRDDTAVSSPRLPIDETLGQFVLTLVKEP